MDERYNKSKGKAGLDGIKFQIHLLSVFLLNALRNHQGWRLSTENQDAAKFDDVVMELSDNSAVLLQAKLKETRQITKDLLLSDNSKKSDFSLAKYFFSYHAVKAKFKVKTVVICTNTILDETGLETFLIQASMAADNLLHFEGSTCSLVKFSEDIMTELKENVQKYYKSNPRGIDGSIITNENLKDYLEKLQLVSRYPSGDKLNKVVEKMLNRLSNLALLRNITPQDIYRKVEEWFQQKHGEYFTEVNAKAMFCEIRSDKYGETLQNYNILFKYNDFAVSSLTKRILHVTTDKGQYLLQVLKIYDALKQIEGRKLYINPSDSVEIQKQVVDAFNMPKFTYLVIVWPTTVDQIMLREVSEKLRDTLTKYDRKKVILIAEYNNELPQLIGIDNVTVLHGSVTFKDLTDDTQKRLVRVECIDFQGENTSMEKLFTAQPIDCAEAYNSEILNKLETLTHSQNRLIKVDHTNFQGNNNSLETPENYAKAVNSEIIEKLIIGQKLKVGIRPVDLDTDITKYYIERVFERQVRDEMDKVRNFEKQTQAFSENSIFDIEEKVILLADSAGMGKSTVLTKLASNIKKKYPQLWVVMIKLSEYTAFLKESSQKQQSIRITELLDSRRTGNHLEKVVFSLERKVVLLLDEFDEICPDYSGSLINLLIDCLKAPNFEKVIVTTRPHLAEELKDTLQVKPFVMQPFTEPNQVDFLIRYWMHNLAVDLKHREKCEQYAKALITKMHSSMKLQCESESQLVAIPLQIKMLADIFQDNIQLNMSEGWQGCKQFLLHKGAPKLPEKLNIRNLYDIFIEKKRDLFIDKGSPSGNVIAIKALKKQFSGCLGYHRSLALDVVLDETKRNLFSAPKETGRDIATDLLKIGIVQQFDDKFQFIHRSFAEYFFAETLLTELRHNRHVEFQRFFLDEFLLNPEYAVCRGFLENLLMQEENAPPSNVFKDYHKLEYNSTLSYHMPHDNLIYILAQENCVAILRYILLCLDFRLVGNNDIQILNYRQQIRGRKNYFKRSHFENSFCFLKSLVREGGVNIRDIHNCTPLHYAAERGHSQMVKYLLEQGADVNSKDGDHNTGVHLASRWGSSPTVKVLAERGADVNFINQHGTTALHLAAEWGNLDIVKFLIEKKANVTIRNQDGNTALHLAVELFRLDIIKVLVDNGADINAPNDHGLAAIHLASQKGWASMVRSLVQYGAQVNIKNNEGCTPVHLAIQKGCWNTVKVLIEVGADVNISNNNGCAPIHIVVQKDWFNAAKYLLKLGADINIEDDRQRTPLDLAMENRHLEIVNFLKKHEAICHRDDLASSVVDLATPKGHFDKVEVLYESRRETKIGNEKFLRKRVSSCGDNSPNDMIAEISQLKTVKFLSSNGNNFIKEEKDGDNALLHLSAGKGDLDTIRCLLQKGIDISTKDDSGNTALHLAAAAGEVEVVRLCLEQGVDINAKNERGCAPIHLAAQMAKFDTLNFLVIHGADINVANCSGNTALHLAAEEDREDIIEYLLSQGADINVINSYGCAPIHLAAEGGKWHIVEILVKWGADFNIENNEGYTVKSLFERERKALQCQLLSCLKFPHTIGNDTSKPETSETQTISTKPKNSITLKSEKDSKTSRGLKGLLNPKHLKKLFGMNIRR